MALFPGGDAASPDPARSRLRTLAAPPTPPRREPASGEAVSREVLSREVLSREVPQERAGQRVGWPSAAPGTPASRLRFPERPDLPGEDDGYDDPDDEFDEDDGYGDDGYGDEDDRDGRRRDRGRERPSAWSEESWGNRVAARWFPAAWREARWDPGRVGALALAIVAALAAVAAAIGVWSGRPTVEPMPSLPVVESAAARGAPASSASSATAAPVPGAPLVVSVAGKVARPGLVRVPDGSRVGDAVDAAGGALTGTDLTALNLAARLHDGDQVLVGVDPPPGAAAGSGTAAAGTASAGTAGDAAAAGGAPAPGGPVDLNTATLEQLDALPGVGPVTAKKILDWRTQNGRFASVDQLQEVDGIGDARFATLRELVAV